MKPFIFAFAFMLISTPVFGQTIDIDVQPIDSFEKKDVERVALLLADIHKLPSQEILEASPNAAAIVKSLATTGDDLVRDRAVIATLKYWPSSDAYLIAARIIASADTRFATRVRTMLAFSEVFGDRAVPVVRVYLTHADPQMRITAVQAMALSDDGFEELKALQASTTDEVLLGAIDRFGRRLQ